MAQHVITVDELDALRQVVAERSEDPMRFFGYKHLPEHLQPYSAVFFGLAKYLVDNTPDNEQRRVALHYLMLAKDAAVRARL